MIVAENLSKRFGKVLAVDSVEFRIRRGQVVGFLGPNGAGKTTAIRMIAGYLRPSGGAVKVDSLDVATRGREVRRRIGYLPESAPLYHEMPVAEYLRFRAKLYGLRRRMRNRLVESALRRCWLGDVRRRPIGQLSKGYRQRVGLAAALVHEPPVLILDEPTVGLDPTQIREVRGLIRELAGTHTILLSTHILPEAEQICDAIMIMTLGRIGAHGSLAELRAQAAERSRYVVETDSPEAPSALRAVAGVCDIEVSALEKGWRRLLVTPAEGAGDLRSAIAAALRQRGAAVRELRREQPTLEQLFVQVAGQGVPARAPLDAGKGGAR